ncbi:hypothetical protein AGMMS49525_16490 [Bacteroidia bacterium]|nr:hypothetical protein AGMMS49525_16490 [Bacteroidia bacterium]
MQGLKTYEEKIFVNFQLSAHVPSDNFYRRLRNTLDLTSLRKMTQKYYGTEGQKSIETEVFFKLMLIGYLENINSDRKIVETAGMRWICCIYWDMTLESLVAKESEIFYDEVVESEEANDKKSNKKTQQKQ